MKKLTLFIIIIFLFVIPYVFSDGICSTVKDNYSPGEIATFQCFCTEGNEEDTDGYINFFHENGTQLSTTFVNSGKCDESFFGDSYLIPQTETNYTIEANFSKDPDGKDIPKDWDNINDVTSKIFSVTGFNITDCLISNIRVPELVTLGIENANVFTVTDGASGDPIVGINCMALVFATDNSPILLEPYGKTYDNYRTVAGGTGYLTALFKEDRFETGITYEFNLYCQCTNNSENDAVCYNDNTGERLGFKSCSTGGLFTTSKEDKRYLTKENNLTGTMLIFIMLIIFYAGFGVHSYQKANPDVGRIDYWISFLCFNLAVFMLLLGLGIAHGYTTGKNYTVWLNITLLSNAIIIFLGGFVIWVRHLLGMASFTSPKLRKWDKGKWGPK